MCVCACVRGGGGSSSISSTAAGSSSRDQQQGAAGSSMVMRTYFAAPVLMTGCAANVHPVTGSAPATDAVKPDGLLLLLRPALGSAFEQSPHRKPIATIHNLKLSGHTIRLLHLQRLANLGVGLSLSVSRHRTFFERPRGSCRGEVIFPLRNDVESFCSVSHNWCAGVVAVALRTTCAMTSATRKRSWFIHLRNPIFYSGTSCITHWSQTKNRCSLHLRATHLLWASQGCHILCIRR
jgi:hypothetical protein